MRGSAADARRTLARIRALSRRGFSRAAQSLGRMLGRRVRFTLREAGDLSSSALPALADQLRSPAAGLRIRIQGDGEGSILIVLPFPMVYRFLQRLMGMPPEPRSLTEAECSAVQEVGNVLASSFLSELGDLLGRRWLPSPPELHLDNIPRLAREVLASLPVHGAESVVVHALLEDRQQNLEGQVFVLWDRGTLEPLVQAAHGEQGVTA